MSDEVIHRVLGDAQAAGGLTAPWGWSGLEVARWCLQGLGKLRRMGLGRGGEGLSTGQSRDLGLWCCVAMVVVGSAIARIEHDT